MVKDKDLLSSLAGIPVLAKLAPSIGTEVLSPPLSSCPALCSVELSLISRSSSLRPSRAISVTYCVFQGLRAMFHSVLSKVSPPKTDVSSHVASLEPIYSIIAANIKEESMQASHLV
jgi:hypothetical protein